MADLFTRLVSGPAAAVQLAPRVPALLEPAGPEPSYMDEPESAGPPAPVSHVDTPVVVERVRPEPESPPVGVRLRVQSKGESPQAGSLPAQTEAEAEPRGQAEPRVEVAPVVRSDVSRAVRSEAPVSRQSERATPELRPRRSERDSAQRRTESAARTVRISIGRIEIRAPQPPAAPIPPPAPAPSRPGGLSLAEYLRGNDGRPR